MNVTFRIVPHAARQGSELVEVWFGEKMVAAIYPYAGHDELHLRLMSNHMLSSRSTGIGTKPVIYEFTFDTKPNAKL